MWQKQTLHTLPASRWNSWTKITDVAGRDYYVENPNLADELIRILEQAKRK